MDHAASRASKVALWVGILLSVSLLVFGDLEPGKPQVTAAAAVALLMACWWIGEAVPLAVTSLLPMVLFPLLGVMDGKAVASRYFDDNIFLYLGGFMVALAMERWGLHRRMALRILLWFGVHPRWILLGFMAATGFLSMWISNTAASMMMVPIALAILSKLADGGLAEGSLAEPPGADGDRQTSAAADNLSVGVLLGVAYAASIGGMATLVGTPTNLALTKIFGELYPAAPPISFVTWLKLGLPFAVAMLVATWLVLVWRFVPRHTPLSIDREVLRRQYDELGPMSMAEKIVLADFCVLVVLWLTRADIALGSVTIPGWSRLFREPAFITDGAVSVAAAVALFLLPARSGGGGRVMNWATAAKLPWDIVLLFGGGFALAAGFEQSGLSRWLGESMTGLAGWPPLVILAVVCLMVTFLTELTSNTATANALLPVVAAMAVGIGLNPLFLMVPVTITCSCAFMLPVATPPNAIVFGTRRIAIAQMARTGLALNLVGVILVIIGMYGLGVAVWGIELGVLPAWATVPAPLPSGGQ